MFGVVALAVWEVASRLYDQPYLLPAPSQIARELGENWELVLAYAWITTQEVVVGFTLGSVVGAPGRHALPVAARASWRTSSTA